MIKVFCDLCSEELRLRDFSANLISDKIKYLHNIHCPDCGKIMQKLWCWEQQRHSEFELQLKEEKKIKLKELQHTEGKIK